VYVPPPGSTPGPIVDMRARLRPMGIGDILDETFRLYRENFTRLVATVAIIEVPYQIILLLVGVGFIGSVQSLPGFNGTTFGQPITPPQAARLSQSSLAFFAFLPIFGIVTVAALTILAAAMAFVISNRYLNRTVTVGQAYGAVVQRIGALLLALLWIVVRFILLVVAISVLAGIFSAAHLGVVALILGLAIIPLTLYFGIAWSLFPQAAVLDGVGGIASTRRSRQLIAGYWWKTFAVVLLTALLVFIVGQIPTAIINGIVGTATGSLVVRTIITGIIGLIVGVLVRPIQVSALTLLFYDLKIRKEAFDLEALVQQAGAPTPTVPYQ
jgi:hypothetical protein